MPSRTPLNPLKLLGVTEALLRPIQILIEKILPDFLEQDLRKEGVRTRIVAAVDTALVSQQPAARAVPKSVRRRIIRRLLDVMIDEILLP